MKKSYFFRLIVFIFLTMCLNSREGTAQLTRLSQGFDNYIGSVATVPAGWYISWNSTSSPSYYITSGNYGAAIPSYKFGNNGDEIISPYFSSGDTLRFWYKGQGLFSAQNTLVILYSQDSTNWNGLVSIDTLLVTGTTFSYPLPCEAHYLMFIYNQASGNLAFDDVLVTMTDFLPVAAAATTLNMHCAGDTICFFDMSTIQGCDTIGLRVWDFGDSTATDSSANPCHIFSQAGNYIVKLFVTASNGHIDSTSLNITINPLPSAQFSDVNVTGTMVDFTDLSSVPGGGIINWYWDFGDSTFSIQQNPAHFFPSVGVYYVCLTATSNSGCSSMVCDSVYVIGAGIEDYSGEKLEISVFPNPVKDKLYVICNTLYGNEWLELSDALGERIFKSEIRNAKSEIDIDRLPNGIYFLKVMTDRKSEVRKVLIAN
jgi:PKD repeat protein